jgi:hypothetical protein
VQDVKLLDITGKAIPVLFSNDKEGIRADVSGLRQGMYLLQVRLSDGKVLTQRFVKR